MLDLALFKSQDHRLISCSGDLVIRMWNLITFECEILPIGLVTSLLIRTLKGNVLYARPITIKVFACGICRRRSVYLTLKITLRF